MAEFIAAGRTVPAENGWKWIVQGWNLFKRAPGIWIATTVLWTVIGVAVGFIPILGPLASVVLGQVFVAGMLIGCRALEEGKELKVEHLFAGFRERFRTLVSIGLLYLGAMIVVTLITGLLVGFKLFDLLGSGQVDPSRAYEILMTALLAILIWMALILPAIMAVWFAPALALFHELGAVAAIKSSFTGCLRNVVPFLVYGLILLLPAIIASIPFFLGWLVLGPLLIASLYTAYRDIYFS